MVNSCSAFGCKNRWNKHQKVLFHKFPLNDPERLQKWLKAIKRESWQPTKHSFLCSKHFTADSYKSNPKFFLRDDAVPSLFCFSTDFPKVVINRTEFIHSLPMPAKKNGTVLQKKVISQESSDPVVSLGIQSETLHKSRDKSCNGSSLFGRNELQIYSDLVDENLFASDEEIKEFSDIEFSDSEDTKQRLDIMTSHYQRVQRKFKRCQQRCKLYKKEINALKEVISSLKQINSVNDDS